MFYQISARNFFTAAALLATMISAGWFEVNANDRTISALDSRIAYMGRIAETDSGVVMGFPGIAIRFAYSGPAPSLRFHANSPNCYFNLSCNGWDPVVIRLNEGENTIALPTGKAPAEGWEIELVRRTESWMGVATFEGLTAPEGCKLVPPPPFPNRRILLIGDSPACGEYIERFPPEDEGSPRTTNAARSYGMLLGRWLDAQVHLVAYGGRGIVTDWAARTETNNAPQFFPLSLPDDPTARWDHSRYKPDVIIISLGTADYLDRIPDENRFMETYAKFLGEVRSAHPEPPIILTESVTFTEEPGTKRHPMRLALRRSLESVIDQVRTTGEQHITLAPLSHQPGTPGDPHPTAFQHEQTALELMGPVKEATGW